MLSNNLSLVTVDRKTFFVKMSIVTNPHCPRAQQFKQTRNIIAGFPRQFQWNRTEDHEGCTVFDRFTKIAIAGLSSSQSCDLGQWCSDPENLRCVGDCIGMHLECVEPEVRAGPIRTGTLCKDKSTGAYVLIQNGLPPTKLAHLIQLKINAAEYQLLNIVWISEYFDEKHRAILRWLNRTDFGGFRFFGIEIGSYDANTELPAEKEEQFE